MIIIYVRVIYGKSVQNPSLMKQSLFISIATFIQDVLHGLNPSLTIMDVQIIIYDLFIYCDS